MLNAIEASDELVVLTRGDGVELVVVAAGAVHGQTKKRLPYRGRQLLEFVVPRCPPHRFAGAEHGVVWTGDEEPYRCGSCQAVRLENIAGKLHASELVVGHVRVEGTDQPVAVVPGMLPRIVVFVAIAFTETSDVQPVPRPAFPVVW